MSNKVGLGRSTSIRDDYLTDTVTDGDDEILESLVKTATRTPTTHPRERKRSNRQHTHADRSERMSRFISHYPIRFKLKNENGMSNFPACLIFLVTNPNQFTFNGCWDGILTRFCSCFFLFLLIRLTYQQSSGHELATTTFSNHCSRKVGIETLLPFIKLHFRRKLPIQTPIEHVKAYRLNCLFLLLQ